MTNNLKELQDSDAFNVGQTWNLSIKNYIPNKITITDIDWHLGLVYYEFRGEEDKIDMIYLGTLEIDVCR